MGAIKPSRRKGTARELGERFNRHPRTIQRVMAEPRDAFEARARARQAQALALRARGLSYAQIGGELGVSRNAAAGLVRRGRQNSSTSAAA